MHLNRQVNLELARLEMDEVSRKRRPASRHSKLCASGSAWALTTGPACARSAPRPPTQHECVSFTEHTHASKQKQDDVTSIPRCIRTCAQNYAQPHQLVTIAALPLSLPQNQSQQPGSGLVVVVYGGDESIFRIETGVPYVSGSIVSTDT